MAADPMMPPQAVLDNMATHCRCCRTCASAPCDGVMAGGMCDEARCSCDDDFTRYDDVDDDDAEGGP